MGMDGEVLVIDDDPAAVVLVELLLEDMGLTILSAATATEGLEYVRGGFQGVIILDHHLPDGTGAALFPTIARDTPQNPVIFLTAEGRSDLAVTAIQQGAFDYITKSHVHGRLVQAVTRAFAKHGEAARRESPEDRRFPGVIAHHTAGANGIVAALDGLGGIRSRLLAVPVGADSA